MPAELTLASRLFNCTLSVPTDGPANGFIYRDALSKGPAADYLLFGGSGASSSEIQLSPLSSRTVLSRTTLKFFLINIGFARASCSAVVIPIVLSFFEILRPPPRLPPPAAVTAVFPHGGYCLALTPARHQTVATLWKPILMPNRFASGLLAMMQPSLYLNYTNC